PPNEITAVLGKTGHGKTEVIKQVADRLRLTSDEKVSFVFQAPYLYNDSLMNNVLLGREVSKSDVSLLLEYLELFGLDYFAESDQELLDLEVGEHGTRLSGGQAKRLCIIRSLMSDASTLIWDDPFSSVDVILEKDIMKKLRPILDREHKTVILTSHRLSTVEESDNIYLLDKEEGIIESGKSATLLNNPESKLHEYFKDQMV
ncbi:MAG: ATP-binding cassette domain-containing protein, partial [Bacteriovoracaceae bacterium]|nr:ATP-binding cassette domain-containing protein [Bacteriovoracaceae bacterium]